MVRLCSVSRVNIHIHCVELLQGLHGSQQKDDNPATLYSLDGSSQDIRSDRFKILKNAHSKSISQNLFCLLVVGVPHIGTGNKQLKGVVLVRIPNASGNLGLYLLGSLLTVRCEAQVLFVAPEHRRPGRHTSFRQQIMQSDHLVLSAVAHDHKEASVVAFHIIPNKGGNAGVQFLPLGHAMVLEMKKKKWINKNGSSRTAPTTGSPLATEASALLELRPLSVPRSPSSSAPGSCEELGLGVNIRGRQDVPRWLEICSGVSSFHRSKHCPNEYCSQPEDVREGCAPSRTLNRANWSRLLILSPICNVSNEAYLVEAWPPMNEALSYRMLWKRPPRIRCRGSWYIPAITR